MSASSKIKEINNAQEFKEFYLEDSHYSYCAACNANAYTHGSGFLEMVALEDIQQLHHRHIGHQAIEQPILLSRKEQLVAQFQLLIHQHFPEKKQVNEYAGSLHVHTHYLNEVVKEVSGFSASHFIQQQLIQEAKSRLLQTNDTVSMIASALNFVDDSYFGRFFKKLTG